jgi:23S rRNA A2030 N6-methylase RlmJ
MKYNFEMGSAAMILITVSSFIEMYSGTPKLMRGIRRHTDRLQIA